MSLVHGGPGPQCFSKPLYEALVNDIKEVVVSLEDVYDPDLQSSLSDLSVVKCKEEAAKVMSSGDLLTVLDLAGTYRPVREPLEATGDIQRIVNSTVRWYVLGRTQPALESFKEGLSALGVLGAVKKYPGAFHNVFCYSPTKLTAEIFEGLFIIIHSEVGSNKAVKESLVLSRWHDFIQDVEDGETSLTLSDILFFVTGCKVVPPRQIVPSIKFLHEPEQCGELSRFPTCVNMLLLPVEHVSYEQFKADMCFGIQNARGFGMA